MATTTFDPKAWDAHKNRVFKDYTNLLKDAPCHDCQKRFPPECMDFDHRDPADKKYQIAGMSNFSKEKVFAELAKCDLVCANCHRVRSHGERWLWE